MLHKADCTVIELQDVHNQM